MKMKKRLKTRRRYRLMFISENTLNTLWTLRMSRARMWGFAAVCAAAFIALIFCILVWSPVSYLLPGYMRPEQRRTTVDNTLRVDSLLRAADNQRLYVDNILAILSDNIPADTVAAAGVAAEVADTLVEASEAERAFVQSWLEKERGNLSVLTPVVAEGMMFRPPLAGAVLDEDGATFRAAPRATVVAIQDAAVIDVRVDAASGTFAITLQHSNDFVSVCSGLVDAFVAPGRRVVAGQALGLLGSGGALELTVWHMGSRADLSKLLPAN